MSFRLLRKQGYYWDNKEDNNLLVRKDASVLCQMEERHRQQAIEYVQPGSLKSAFNSSRLPSRQQKRRISSRDVRPDSKGDARLWHLRLGHPGPMSLHLGINALGVKLQGPKTTECQHCSLAKIKRQISRRSSERNIDKPYFDLHIRAFGATYPSSERYRRTLRGCNHWESTCNENRCQSTTWSMERDCQLCSLLLRSNATRKQ